MIIITLLLIFGVCLSQPSGAWFNLDGGFPCTVIADCGGTVGSCNSGFCVCSVYGTPPLPLGTLVGDACQFQYGGYSCSSDVDCYYGHCDTDDGWRCRCDEGYTGLQCTKKQYRSGGGSCTVSGDCNGPYNGWCNTTAGECACYEGYFIDDCSLKLEDVCLEGDHDCCDLDLDCNSQGTCLHDDGKDSCPVPCTQERYPNDYCDCDIGFYGHQCNVWDCGLYPSTHPDACSGHGTCETPGNPTCTCDPGYDIAPLCNTWLCYGVPNYNPIVCSDKGSCESPDNCDCDPGYDTNPDCSWDCYGVVFTNPLVCSGHGDCTGWDTCSCETGYSGADCELWYCYGELMSSSQACDAVTSPGAHIEGTCVAPDTCECPDRYYISYAPHSPEKLDLCVAEDCFEIYWIQPEVCSGNGECTEPDTCDCDAQFFGTECETAEQCYGVDFNDPAVCHGHGDCTAPETCDCDIRLPYPYHLDADCGHTECYNIEHDDPAVCSGHGTCVDWDTCECAPYYGDECENWDCFGHTHDSPLACNNNVGQCVGADTCDCPDYPAGMTWDSECNPTLVGGGGCIDDDDCGGEGVGECVSECICLVGVGANCENWFCNSVANTDPAVCSGHGTCDRLGNCTCDAGHSGDNCEPWQCFGVDKDNHTACGSCGTCVSSDNCDCLVYGGAREPDCDPVAIGGASCLGGDPVECAFHQLDQSGVSHPSGSCVENVCRCSPFYDTPKAYGANCQYQDCYCVAWDDPAVCTAHGICIQQDLCECDPGYVGDECQFWQFQFPTCYGFSSEDPDVCSGRGDCVDTDTCDCYGAYYSVACQSWDCFGIFYDDTDTCSDHGFCVDYNVCECDAGYGGIECEGWGCYGYLPTDPLACSGKGTCVSPDTCTCDPGYGTEPDCSYWECFGVAHNSSAACFGHGECTGIDTCDCETGYIGIGCAVAVCYGLAAYDIDVCSGHGLCLNYDDCTCDAGYTGLECQDWHCSGTLNDDAGVCGGHGECEAVDTCVCDAGYYGPVCSEWDCHNVSSTDPLVCSGSGVCATPDNCTCDEGHGGIDCSTWNCHGIPKEDVAVCSSRGDCESYDVCVCDTGYYGTECESYACFGIDSESPGVCSWHGTCDDIDSCTCTSFGWSGPECSVAVCDPVCDTLSSGSVCVFPDVCECPITSCDFDLPTGGGVCRNPGTDPDEDCNMHGACNLDVLCECHPGYYGANCVFEYGVDCLMPNVPTNCTAECPCDPDVPTNCTAECPCDPDVPTNCTAECPCDPDVPTNCTAECPCPVCPPDVPTNCTAECPGNIIPCTDDEDCGPVGDCDLVSCGYPPFKCKGLNGCLNIVNAPCPAGYVDVFFGCIPDELDCGGSGVCPSGYVCVGIICTLEGGSCTSDSQCPSEPCLEGFCECPPGGCIQIDCPPDVPTNCTAECPCDPDVPTNCTAECPCPDCPGPHVHHKCSGVWANDSSVCSGKGYCVDTDTCECSPCWTGSQCGDFDVISCTCPPDVPTNCTAECPCVQLCDPSVCVLDCGDNGQCLKDSSCDDVCDCDDGWGGETCATLVEKILCSEIKESKITATDLAAPGDQFGVSVSIDGNYTLVGANGFDSYRGAAHVFIKSGDLWTQQHRLTASDGATDDNFGSTVSVSGDYAVVGAYGHNSYTGAAYVFMRSGVTWTQQAKLTASDASTDDYFGISVSISGDYIIVGAYGDDSYTGSAYIFVRSGTSWSQQDKLTASDGDTDDNFGWAVSLSGDYAIVGAYGDADGGLSSGSAYVFVRSGTSWSQQDKLTASDAAAFDNFGTAVSIDADYAVIGANQDNTFTGSAYVFVRSGLSWSQQDKLTAFDGVANDNFGSTVSLSGNYAVVGAFGDDDDGSSSGSAYIFVRSGTSWTEHAKFTASDGAPGDAFGVRVSISSDDYVVVGSMLDDDEGTNSGSAYIYNLCPICTESVDVPPCDLLCDNGFCAYFSTLAQFCVCDAHFEGDLCEDCIAGWTGLDCLTPVCSSPCINGDCVAPDACVCSGPWWGPTCDNECETPVLCGGVPADNSSVCSGHGDCVDTNICDCDEHYSGLTCSTKEQCNGVDYDSQDTCSGHGDGVRRPRRLREQRRVQVRPVLGRHGVQRLHHPRVLW